MEDAISGVEGVGAAEQKLILGQFDIMSQGMGFEPGTIRSGIMGGLADRLRQPTRMAPIGTMGGFDGAAMDVANPQFNPGAADSIERLEAKLEGLTAALGQNTAATSDNTRKTTTDVDATLNN